MRRALVSLPDGAWTVIDKELRGVLGDGESEIIRNLVITALIDHGYLLKNKTPMNKESVANLLNMHDMSIAAIVTVLNNAMSPKDSFYNAYKSEVDKILETQP
jgi:hypothetical protein